MAGERDDKRSRSQLRRIAAQKGEPVPQFDKNDALLKRLRDAASPDASSGEHCAMSEGKPMQLRFLSLRQAQRCETAQEPVCKCRCGGKLHGTKRGQDDAAPSSSRAFFFTLPDDDPHHVDSKERRAERKKVEKAALDKRRLDALVNYSWRGATGDDD